jgi:G:T/U-mismatch repair DNA glycosylase
MLWPVLDMIFSLSLHYDNREGAVEERKAFLRRERLGICDIVESCRRKKIDASDLGMYDITLRDILLQLQKHQDLTTIIFTGGNSKNGPEYLFRKQLRAKKLSLTPQRDEIPRKHTFLYAGKEITTIALTSPSNAANRAIGSTDHYKKQKAVNPGYTTFDFRVEQYRKVFFP